MRRRTHFFKHWQISLKSVNRIPGASPAKRAHCRGESCQKIDPVFTPRRLNPDDAKVLFHPIDFVVFDGMKNADQVKRIVLLDRESSSATPGYPTIY